jgi:alcohol dehydrogenase
LNLGRAITEELEIRGSHGMAAHEYPAMLARITAGDLDPGMSIGGRIGLDELPAALAGMSAAPTHAGFLVAEL